MTAEYEEPILFACGDDTLVGILHHPTGTPRSTGVLLVVGGPQYRVGSHRQFVLLARDLAAKGIPVFRFDFRGMGDSSGDVRSFERINRDIAAAADLYFSKLPNLNGIVLWGLCDAATANALYAVTDNRVVGQVVLNPWVRTNESEARALMKHYYPSRALSGSFWRSVISQRYGLLRIARDFIVNLTQSLGISGRGDDPGILLPQRLCEAQLSYSGHTLIIVSGKDLTAKEYLLSMRQRPEWERWVSTSKVEFLELEDADHTFSRASWRNKVSEWTHDWIRERF